MSDPRLRLSEPRLAALPDAQKPDGFGKPLGRILVDAGHLSEPDLVRALEAQKRLNAPLGRILTAQYGLHEDHILEALATQKGLARLSLEGPHPAPGLFSLKPARFWQQHRAIPWMRMGSILVIATEAMGNQDALRAAFPGRTLVFSVAPEQALLDQLNTHCGRILAQQAENRVAARYSCRNWRKPGLRLIAGAGIGGGGLMLGLWLAPLQMLTVLSILAVLSLTLISGLKLTGLVAQVLGTLHDTPPPVQTPPGKRPRVSVLVPLYKEKEIANHLIQRLRLLTYPKALLDVMLVLEEKDSVTRDALARTPLPPWMRIVEVPDLGTITTKPRALNYALDFCEGEIIGIWDAEDAPAPNQIETITDQFAQCAPETVCLQGILDYYNPRSNWISRCFTIEYASWFRVVLPGLARLKLVIPLGGTTLFIRRHALEALGGWDAHNVTEDADLGVRLARFGWRTEPAPTVTGEEANCRPWAWVRQRSRWLKGFMMTWAVHSRQPRALLRHLGWRRFLGIQAFFIGTVSQFLLAPLLWSFWLIPLGLPHHVALTLPPVIMWAIFGLFFMTELINLIIGCVAVSGPRHRFLMGWTLTMPLYFPMATLAAYKALFELVGNPFYWDKTRHGQAQPDTATP